MNPEERRYQRPRISVCMASYNGRDYLGLQLASVLSQLGPDDEVVIVDDGSKDGAPEVILSVGDPRIRMIEHESNLGVVATFEDALRAAKGDLLFLCDNDDLWASDKVQMFLDAFEAHPQANIVISQVSFIDGEGRPIQSELYQNRKGFHAGFWSNVLRNHFQGSAMALRRSLLAQTLPFPRDVEFLHDCWIGTRNAWLGGSVVYLEKDLLLYRRHGRNYSAKKPFRRQVLTRFQLLREHLRRSLS